MAVVQTIDGDLYVRGKVIVEKLEVVSQATLPADSISNLQIASSAGIDPVKATSQRVAKSSDPAATNASSKTEYLFTALGSGTLKAFKAGAVVANVGAATVTVDLKKNGASVLTAAITLNNGQVAYQIVSGTISSTAFVANDVFTVTFVATAGGGTLATGVFAQVSYNEANVA